MDTETRRTIMSTGMLPGLHAIETVEALKIRYTNNSHWHSNIFNARLSSKKARIARYENTSHFFSILDRAITSKLKVQDLTRSSPQPKAKKLENGSLKEQCRRLCETTQASKKRSMIPFERLHQVQELSTSATSRCKQPANHVNASGIAVHQCRRIFLYQNHTCLHEKHEHWLYEIENSEKHFKLAHHCGASSCNSACKFNARKKSRNSYVSSILNGGINVRGASDQFDRHRPDSTTFQAEANANSNSQTKPGRLTDATQEARHASVIRATALRDYQTSRKRLLPAMTELSRPKVATKRRQKYRLSKRDYNRSCSETTPKKPTLQCARGQSINVDTILSKSKEGSRYSMGTLHDKSCWNRKTKRGRIKRDYRKAKGKLRSEPQNKVVNRQGCQRIRTKPLRKLTRISRRAGDKKDEEKEKSEVEGNLEKLHKVVEEGEGGLSKEEVIEGEGVSKEEAEWTSSTRVFLGVILLTAISSQMISS
ncbi:hypothetical protein BJ508DRAFT_310118 [Ascobolus immersus RN42]|uniref:Uncharacterized protein n=1 Tax=Ascobolus immersus RN42 TaxID=1160509 RepID=A0A3N4I6X2_ASCIM|nr:hypothetical protein BJ508DRAFT_310118 [Ascobolus immersus RN42]